MQVLTTEELEKWQQDVESFLSCLCALFAPVDRLKKHPVSVASKLLFIVLEQKFPYPLLQRARHALRSSISVLTKLQRSLCSSGD